MSAAPGSLGISPPSQASVPHSARLDATGQWDVLQGVQGTWALFRRHGHQEEVRAERTLLAVAGSAGCPPQDTVTSGCAPGAGASLTPGEEASSGTCEVTGLVRVR